MLYIRADGNTDIGMGHVMRCLSIAEAAADIDSINRPVFITADEDCCGIIRDRGFQAIVLNTDYRDMMSELPQLEKIFNKEYDILLVDSYQVSREYYIALRKLVKTACLEDMGDTYPVGLLINYNIYAPQLEQNYKAQNDNVQNQNSEPSAIYPEQLLLGAKYMPLRKAFQKPSEYVVRDKVTNVTISTGGSDPFFAASALTDALINDSYIQENNINLHIVSGPFNSFVNQLKGKYQACKNITIHEAVKDMRSLFLESDVVISATGSTIYEISSLGVPMIVFYFAENQRRGAEALEKLTDIVNAGCFTDNSEAVTSKAADALRKCIRDKSYRMLLNQQEVGLIDGKGAARIASVLADIQSR